MDIVGWGPYWGPLRWETAVFEKVRVLESPAKSKITFQEEFSLTWQLHPTLQSKPVQIQKQGKEDDVKF